MGACCSSPMFGERSGTHFLLTCPFFLAVPQPALPCCCGGEAWVMAGFERDFFICLQPQVPPLTCLNISTQACTSTGPLLFCPPPKQDRACVPVPVALKPSLSWFSSGCWGMVPHGQEPGLAPVPAVPPAVPPVPLLPLG